MRPKTSRRLRLTVVLVVTALVALVAGSAVALATLPTNTSSATWTGNGSDNIDGCQTGLHWILTPAGPGSLVSATLYVDFGSGYVSYAGYQPGGNGAFHFDSGAGAVSAAYAEYSYTGDIHTGNVVLTISHCNDDTGATTTTVVGTSTTEESTSTTEESTSTTEESTSTTTGRVTSTTDESTSTTTGEATSTTAAKGSLRITKTIQGYNPQGLKFEDFKVMVTGPSPSATIVFYDFFDEFGVIQIDDLVPGEYTVTEQAPGYPWDVAGNGPVTVVASLQTGVTIINTGSTSTTEELVTSTTDPGTSTTTKRLATTTTTAGTETTSKSNGTTSTAVFGFSNTTVFGWVAQPDDVQTGLGGMAGDGNGWALIVLVLSSTLLASVLVASAIGVRTGVL